MQAPSPQPGCFRTGGLRHGWHEWDLSRGAHLASDWCYATTRFSRRFATYITLRTPLPSVNLRTVASRTPPPPPSPHPIPRHSHPCPRLPVHLHRHLHLILHHQPLIPPRPARIKHRFRCPIRSQLSSAKCGANGASMTTSPSTSVRCVQVSARSAFTAPSAPRWWCCSAAPPSPR